ncbi:HAD family phosphatase [Nocardioides sp. ChNu-153]|uniref:HAD family hydrolase n=1 Tax=Nocardioides sp. ChNu-153 TaxID=2779364 RepID=UPI0026552EB7|nr:HAD family hydrolase [Nocardioides sp. ChNu-153]MDN7123100.1 HAD family phosphatase [Nocardioides sp. ChNu-153]
MTHAEGAGGAPRTDGALPRLVATDLDGTLLGADGRVSDRTRAVLVELDARGVPVVFVTGRPIRWMEDLWADVGGHGLAVCSNGGIVYDVAARAVRTARPVPGAVLLEVADRLRAAVPGTVLALETTEGLACEPAWAPRPSGARDPRDAEPLVAPFPELAERSDGPAPCVKLLARHPTRTPEVYWGEVEEAVGDLVTVTWSSTGALVEMSAAGVTKASTLALLCDELGVAPAEVVAFGDMPNDIPLLSWAGTSYAMADAHPALVAVAGHRAGPHDADGVAAALAAVFGLAGWPAAEDPDEEEGAR